MANNWKIPIQLETEILSRDTHCIYCGVEISRRGGKEVGIEFQGSWEHIINDASIITRENIARCCRPCNSSKGTKTLSDWLKTEYCKRKNITPDTIAPVAKGHLKIGTSSKKQLYD